MLNPTPKKQKQRVGKANNLVFLTADCYGFPSIYLSSCSAKMSSSEISNTEPSLTPTHSLQVKPKNTTNLIVQVA